MFWLGMEDRGQECEELIEPFENPAYDVIHTIVACLLHFGKSSVEGLVEGPDGTSPTLPF